jgi:hypothetical protein
MAPSRSTVAFGAGQAPVPAKPAAAPARPALELEEAPRAPTPSPAVAPKPAAPLKPAAPVAAPARAAAAATSDGGEMAARLAGMGLTREQVEGVLGLSREIIERVVWEVVPDLAETIIREEIKRLTAD